VTVFRQVTGKDGVSLATEAFGTPGDAPLILIMGATTSMLGWPDAFCLALAARGRFVVRFDHRDTGGSTTLPPGPPTYSVEDMARDVLAVMDGWGIDQADLMGMSLGGYIAQVAALLAPDRVHSLILFAAEPLGWDGAALPSISDVFMDHFETFAALDWQDRAAVTEMMVQSTRLCEGDPKDFDEVAERQTVAKMLDRTSSPQSAFNHGMVSLSGDWAGAARQISCPVLVLHGDKDPILPLPNGQAIAAMIPHARLKVFAGLGHALPASYSAEMTGVIDDFLKSLATRQTSDPQMR